MKKIKALVLLCLIGTTAWSQVTTNSPYSNYGIGELSRRSSIYNKGIGGTGIGLQSQNQINILNPAALSIDSLTFLLDVGLITSQYKLKDDEGNSASTGSTGFEYLSLAFPVTKWWNAAIGLFPYSKVGYNYAASGTTMAGDTVAYSYNGRGGINQAVISQSFNPIKPLRVGICAGYLFGDVERHAYAKPNVTSYSTNLYKDYYHSGLLLDVGAQWAVNLSTDYSVTIGGVFSYSPVMQYNYRRYLQRSVTYQSHDSVIGKWDKMDIAPSFGGGLGFCKKEVYNIGVDVSMQQWKDKSVYGEVNASLKNSMRISAGGDWTPNRYAPRGYFKRVNYRFGVWYENSYIQVQPTGKTDYEAIVAKGVSFGLSLPFRQTMNKVQLAFEYGQRSCPTTKLIDEQFFSCSFGFRIHESWFYKRKYD